MTFALLFLTVALHVAAKTNVQSESLDDVLASSCDVEHVDRFVAAHFHRQKPVTFPHREQFALHALHDAAVAATRVKVSVAVLVYC